MCFLTDTPLHIMQDITAVSCNETHRAKRPRQAATSDARPKRQRPDANAVDEGRLGISVASRGQCDRMAANFIRGRHDAYFLA
jgi:hypothetical protein